MPTAQDQSTRSDENDGSPSEDEETRHIASRSPQQTPASPSIENRLESRLYLALRSYADPISPERIIGTTLFILSLIKTITLLSTESSVPEIRLAGSIALAYSFSFIVFELLVWSLVCARPEYELMDLPVENVLELLRAIDPGDNPFTFPSLAREESSGSDFEMTSAATQIHARSQPPKPWDKSVGVCAASSLAIGPVIWVFLFHRIWSSNKVIFFLTVAALSFFGMKVGSILAVRAGHASISQRLMSNIPTGLRTEIQRLSVTRKLWHAAESRPELYALRWVLERITTVNLFSALWVGVILLYFIGSFGQGSGQGEGKPLLRPMWLDWLG
jgi:hypothetical protein